ncbi:MAG: hypothetical protein ACKVU2_11425 [Saprospiraceae bacterium]
MMKQSPRYKANFGSRMTTLRTRAAAAACVLSMLAGCGGAGTPLDAGTRDRIDSMATAQIRLAQLELDSLCVVQRAGELPRMVDSIKGKRLQEIERQLRTVPK